MEHEAPITSPIYHNLRQNILALEPGQIKVNPTTDASNLLGILLEIGYTNGTATLVMLVDGTTSLYLSSGSGIIGCGRHPDVAEAAQNCLHTASSLIPLMEGTSEFALPRPGKVVFYGLTCHGIHTISCAESELCQGNHPFSAVFIAAQNVLTRVRLLHEKIKAG